MSTYNLWSKQSGRQLLMISDQYQTFTAISQRHKIRYLNRQCSENQSAFLQDILLHRMKVQLLPVQIFVCHILKTILLKRLMVVLSNTPKRWQITFSRTIQQLLSQKLANDFVNLNVGRPTDQNLGWSRLLFFLQAKLTCLLAVGQNFVKFSQSFSLDKKSSSLQSTKFERIQGFKSQVLYLRFFYEVFHLSKKGL